MYEDVYQPTEEEVIQLENEVHELKEQVHNMAHDEIFVLSELMLIRDALMSGKAVSLVLDDMQQLIATHSLEVREMAAAKLTQGEFYEA